MIANDTVRLKVIFKSLDIGYPVNPDSVQLKIYNLDNQLIETITEGIVNGSQGIFYHDYVAEDSDFIFEFSGIYNNKPITARKKTEVKFY